MDSEAKASTFRVQPQEAASCRALLSYPPFKTPQFLKYSIISSFLASSKVAVPNRKLVTDTGLKSGMVFLLSIRRNWCPRRGSDFTKAFKASLLRNERCANPASFKEVWERV